VLGLFSTAYGDVGSSIYYALGLVAMVALGATPVALGIAAVFFVFTALTYAEGTAMIPEAGGSATFARHAFSDSAGFGAGWALMFGYIVTIAISAYAIPSYLGYFWAPLKLSPVLSTAVAMGIVGFLILINVLGVRESSLLNFTLAVLSVLIQLLLIALAFAFMFSPAAFIDSVTQFWPPPSDLLFGVAIAAIAFTGVESASQMAEEARKPRVNVPRALLLLIVVVLLIFGGITAAAFSAMTPPELATRWLSDPVAGIANGVSRALAGQEFQPELVATVFNSLQVGLPVVVAALAGFILLIATNAGLMGISRLAFSMSRSHLIPSAMATIHPRYKTPYPAILFFGAIALVLIAPGFFVPDLFRDLGGLYAFGSMLAFSMAHAAVIALRFRKPDAERPFKLRGNIRIAGREIPMTAVLGFIGTLGIWVVIVVLQPVSRYVGFAWMAAGLIMYVVYRWRRRRQPPPSEPVAHPGV